MYVRVSRGGRHAARTQEHRIRDALEVVGIPLDGAHVYCDIDTPPYAVGRALNVLLEEASIGRVGTVVVQTLGVFGSYEVLVHTLMTLERGGADVVVASDIDDELLAERLRAEVDLPGPGPRLVVGDVGVGATPHVQHDVRVVRDSA
jgi:hypothetical protein